MDPSETDKIFNQLASQLTEPTLDPDKEDRLHRFIDMLNLLESGVRAMVSLSDVADISEYLTTIQQNPDIEFEALFLADSVLFRHRMAAVMIWTQELFRLPVASQRLIRSMLLKSIATAINDQYLMWEHSASRSEELGEPPDRMTLLSQALEVSPYEKFRTRPQERVWALLMASLDDDDRETAAQDMEYAEVVQLTFSTLDLMQAITEEMHVLADVLMDSCAVFLQISFEEYITEFFSAFRGQLIDIVEGL